MPARTRQSTGLGLNSLLIVPSQQPGSREDSWEFPSSESRSDDSARENSDLLMHDGPNGVSAEEDDDISDAPSSPMTPDLYGQLITPLQIAAERVGREVEKFAEQLERLNPAKQSHPQERYESALELVDEYESIANAAVDRLKKQHAPAQQKSLNMRWQRRIRSSKQGERLLSSDHEDDNQNELTEEQDEASKTTLADLKYWEQERRTWSLLKQTLEFQLPQPGIDKEAECKEKVAEIGPIHQYSSEAKIWERFLAEDELARERYVVLTWLRQSAEISGNDIVTLMEQLETAADRGRGLWAHGWLYSKEAIKGQKRLRSWPLTLDPSSPGLGSSLLNADKTESLITQLDPDAVTRQRRTLEKQDQYFERATWLACWEMLRRGRGWADIREWCRDRVEGWRAVSLRGGVPAWDAMADGTDVVSLFDEDRRGSTQDNGDSQKSQIEGNRSTALWRRTCFALARNGGLDEYERAVYGILSGDLESVEKVCSSWEDHIFAHYNSLLVSQFEAYVRTHYPDRVPATLTRKFSTFDAVQYHGEPNTVGAHLVNKLKAQHTTTKEASESMKLVQGALIAKGFGDFAYRQGLSLARAANLNQGSRIIPATDQILELSTGEAFVTPDDFDGIRVLCHVLLALQDIGLDIGFGVRQVATENIIVAYIDFLRLSGKITMIPLYASRLSHTRQLDVLSLVLSDVSGSSLRRELVQLMQAYHIDVALFIRAQFLHTAGEAGLMRENAGELKLRIVEAAPPASVTRSQIIEKFVGSDMSQGERLTIASFEWYLFVDGRWGETFEMGVRLFRRFFETKRLAAAQRLAERMSSSRVSKHKTRKLLGEQVDISGDPIDTDDDYYSQSKLATPRLSGPAGSRRRSDDSNGDEGHRDMSPERYRLTRQILVSQAKTYIDFERLAHALAALEEWREAVNEMPENLNPFSDSREGKPWRKQLQAALDQVVHTVEPLLHGWLVDVPEAQKEAMEALRNAYIPEVVLAYNSVLDYAGHMLARENLLQCMNLATTVAAADSDILECFQKTGRLRELVSAFANDSKDILKAEEHVMRTKASGVGRGSRSGRGRTRRRRGLGEKFDLWHVEV